ncbi:MAG: Holliday junction branch migration protein RuvA, partial [Paracoccus sp. (in: a-proteobacteria)]
GGAARGWGPAPAAAAARGAIPGDEARPAVGGAASGQAMADALSALTNLGYGPSEAASAVAEAQAREPTASMPALIRAALRLLAPKE